MRKPLILLSLIFFIACILRFWNLDSLPPALHRDEAYLGYNAYSLLKTGRDMTGDFLPLHLRSFLYSPAGYSYAAIPPIALWGLSAFSTRFPSAFFGSLTIIALYFMVKELFRKSKYKEHLGILSSFLLAILPWHITLSRIATENVLVTFFFVVGIWLYLVWTRKQKWYVIAISFLCFILTLGLYQAPRAFLPLFLPGLFVMFYKQLGVKRISISLAFFCLLIVLPTIAILLSPQLSLRFKTLSITQNGPGQLILDEQIRQDNGYIPLILTRVLHNKLLIYSNEFLSNYFAHFSYDFLFTDDGLPDRYRVPLMGLLYIWQIPLILLGSLSIIQKEKKAAWALFLWLLLAPVGSALTYDDVPNLQRTLFMVIPLCILTAYGFTHILESLQAQKTFVFLISGVLALFCLYGFGFYIVQYTVHEPQYRPWYRNDGYRELVASVGPLVPHFKKTVITNRESAPTIFFLFYLQYSPALFQKETAHSTLKDFDRIGFGKYEFSQEECPLAPKILENGQVVIKREKNVLYVDSGLCMSTIESANQIVDNIQIVKNIKRHDKSLVFSLVTIK